MLRRSFLSGLAAVATGAPAIGDPAAVPEVDVLLVLALDASGSQSDQQITLQREGHARAVQSPRFLDAVAAGLHGRVALSVVEWSDEDRQSVTVPWTEISDRDTARGFADRLMRAWRPIPGATSISGAIDFSLSLLARAPYAADRRVIDIAGNGPNNGGRPLAMSRDDAAEAGVTVNGLPILDLYPDLDRYYAEEVICGPGAFIVVARDLASFAEAVARKLVSEIAELTPPTRVALRPASGACAPCAGEDRSGSCSA